MMIENGGFHLSWGVGRTAGRPYYTSRAREMFASGPGVPFQANKKGPLGSPLCLCVCGPFSQLSVCVCKLVSLCYLLTRTDFKEGPLSSFFFVLLVVCYLVCVRIYVLCSTKNILPQMFGIVRAAGKCRVSWEGDETVP